MAIKHGYKTQNSPGVTEYAGDTNTRFLQRCYSQPPLVTNIPSQLPCNKDSNDVFNEAAGY